jgi:4-hydroxybenzoate polyprenyltransferase
MKNIHNRFLKNFIFNYCEKINTKILENQNTLKYNPEQIDHQQKRLNIINYFPEKIKEYLKLGRYDRPVGYMLLFWPCAWGLTLGAPTLNYEYYKLLTLFFSGSVLMRSSGCIINDMWDKDIDKKVIRSQNRPLASGKISIKGASIFLSGHLTLSLGILLQLPMNSIIMGLGIMPIVCIYPYMKRVTNFPQFFLGLAFNSGVMVGMTSFTGVVNLPVLIPLYSAGILWTLIYDTIYAHMDKLDDKNINVKSTALYFGDQTKLVISIFTIIMMTFFYISIKNYKKNKKTNILTNSALVLATVFQFYSIYRVNLNSPISCLKHFKLSSYFGLLIFISTICANIDEEKDNK